MPNKIIINGIDFTEVIKPILSEDKCYIPVDFLAKFLDADLKTQQNMSIELNFDPAKIITALETKSQNLLGVKIKNEDGKLKAIANISIGQLFNAQADSDGNWNAGLSFKF